VATSVTTPPAAVAAVVMGTGRLTILVKATPIR
jgi:hypothetical protein